MGLAGARVRARLRVRVGGRVRVRGGVRVGATPPPHDEHNAPIEREQGEEDGEVDRLP